jgi:hypothetical protein
MLSWEVEYLMYQFHTARLHEAANSELSKQARPVEGPAHRLAARARLRARLAGNATGRPLAWLARHTTGWKRAMAGSKVGHSLIL